MTTPIKVLLMLVIWALYSFVAYTGLLSHCCPGGSIVSDGAGSEKSEAAAAAAIADAEKAELKRNPVDFQWASVQANTNEGFDAYKKTLLTKATADNILEITGFYHEAEPTPDGYDNMGFARAASLRELLKAEFPDEERIRLKARLMDEADGVRNSFFEGGAFKWLEPEKTAAETVEELDDRIIIRFPYNSTEKDYDPVVDEYLTKLSDRVKQTGEKIALTGHTDNKGKPDYNVQLGQRRANAIQSILVRNGVPDGQITTATKGATQPVATNNTDEGRHENRRVEVRLNKN